MTPLHTIRVLVVVACLNWFSLAAQIANPINPSEDWINSAKDLTLSSALIVAVVVLWKQLGKKEDTIAKKDDVLIESAKQVTKALEQSTMSNVELRKIIDESVAAKRELTMAIDLLKDAIGHLPCTDNKFIR